MHINKANALKYCFTFLFGLCCCATSWANDLYLNGYFTLDASIVDKDLTSVSSVGEMLQYEEGEISFKNSLIGGQFEYELTDNLSLFAQGVAFYDEDDSAKIDINWSYLSYDFDHDIKVRAGVFQTPLLTGTELKSIGYSRLWVRPLIPGSGASGINKYTGVDIVKRWSVGDYNWEFQAAVGLGEHNLDVVDVDGVELISAKVQRDQFWIRTAILHAKYDVWTPTQLLITESADVVMGSIEAEFIQNQFIFNLGFSTSDSKVTPNDTMHYVSVAYQFDEITPFFLWSKRNQLFEAAEVPRPPNAPVGRPLRPTPEGNANFYSVGTGLRWNFADHLAFKVQYEQIKRDDDTNRINSVEKFNGAILTFVIDGAF